MNTSVHGLFQNWDMLLSASPRKVPPAAAVQHTLPCSNVEEIPSVCLKNGGRDVYSEEWPWIQIRYDIVLHGQNFHIG
jgi:hypothetical protein